MQNVQDGLFGEPFKAEEQSLTLGLFHYEGNNMGVSNVADVYHVTRGRWNLGIRRRQFQDIVDDFRRRVLIVLNRLVKSLRAGRRGLR